MRRALSSLGSLTHVSRHGGANMVDVGAKQPSKRTASATGRVLLGQEVFRAVRESESGAGKLNKGPVLFTAQLAGIQAAKKTSDLIPLCHPVPLTKVAVELELREADHSVRIESTVVTASAQTGVEMEALSAVSVAALTVYDMCKALSKGITIADIRLERKSGGKSGDYNRADDTPP